MPFRPRSVRFLPLWKSDMWDRDWNSLFCPLHLFDRNRSNHPAAHPRAAPSLVTLYRAPPFPARPRPIPTRRRPSLALRRAAGPPSRPSCAAKRSTRYWLNSYLPLSLSHVLFLTLAANLGQSGRSVSGVCERRKRRQIRRTRRQWRRCMG
jgi:hypothetical protein